MASHTAKDVRPFAAMVRGCVSRGWVALEQLWVTKRAAALDAAADSRVRAARDEARASACMICIEHGPTVAMLCCGGAFHLRCLKQWLGSQGTACPGCREPVPDAEREALRAAGRHDDGPVATSYNEGYNTGFSEGMAAAARGESTDDTLDDESLETTEDDSREITEDNSEPTEESDDTQVEASATVSDDSEPTEDNSEPTEESDDTGDDTQAEGGAAVSDDSESTEESDDTEVEEGRVSDDTNEATVEDDDTNEVDGDEDDDDTEEY